MSSEEPEPEITSSNQTSLQIDTDLYKEIEAHQWPIVYHPKYNIKLLGIEKLHPFDSQKWGHIFENLKKEGLVDESTVIQPNKARTRDLLQVHSRQYLQSLSWSCTVARITELWPLMLLPNCFLKRKYLRPMRYQTGGSILAGYLALERGWSINLGGGFHHCSSTTGGGFCPYADISLLVRFLLKYHKTKVSKVMIVDLDAHQGNGHERDFLNDSNVYVMDVYNQFIYPHDETAKSKIQRKVELYPYMDDPEYLELVETNLEAALQEFRPDILVYNAGTDILEGDHIGMLAVTPTGVIRRDQLVFMKARERRVPIVMLTSGGYKPVTARLVADSIINLHNIGLISGPNQSQEENK